MVADLTSQTVAVTYRAAGNGRITDPVMVTAIDGVAQETQDTDLFQCINMLGLQGYTHFLGERKVSDYRWIVELGLSPVQDDGTHQKCEYMWVHYTAETRKVTHVNRVALRPPQDLEVFFAYYADLGWVWAGDAQTAYHQHVRYRVMQRIIPRRQWHEIRGGATYPLVGEDAQEWVSRERRGVVEDLHV
jgi:hypothetical protein